MSTKGCCRNHLSRWFVLNIYKYECSFNSILGCTDGEIRLIGGKSPAEGTVEICYYNLWGLILTADWDENDAAVVCKNAGFVQNGRCCHVLIHPIYIYISIVQL